MLCTAKAFPAEKWNIFVAAWENESKNPNRNIELILQKTISSELGKQDNFRVSPGLSTNTVAEYSNAVSIGHDAKADVIVYGSYYVENDRLFVTAVVFDVLENRLKMRRVYTGTVTADIFDTIDAMASDIVRKIKEVLPEMTAESEARVKKIRETLYETEKVNIKRQMYTRFGFVTDLGSKNFILSEDQNNTNSYNGQWPITSMEIGVVLRYWDIRLDFNMNGLPGLPYYDWYMRNFGSVDIPGYVSLTGSYYLPWWEGAFAIGFGIYVQSEYVGTNGDYGNNGNSSMYSSTGYTAFPMSFVVIWNPNHNLELSLQFCPWFEKTNQLYTTNNSRYITYDFPPLIIGATYFFGDIGLSARFTYDIGHYYEIYYSGGGQTSSFEDLFFSIGIIYRVDFL